MSLVTNDYKYGLPELIIDPVKGRGTHQTFADAFADVSSGQTIGVRAGTYTEDNTVPDGINIIAMTDRFSSEMPKVVGKFSMSSGSCSIKGLELETNGDYVISATGTAQVNLSECTLNATDNTLIEHTSSNLLRVEVSGINLQTTGVALYTSTGSGGVYVRRCTGSNGGGSTTKSTKSSGGARIEYCSFPLFFESTSSSGVLIHGCILENSGGNNPCLTMSGTGTSTITECKLASGTASVVNVGSGCTVYCMNSSLNSSNSNVVTGAGTFWKGNLTFPGSSSGINVSTLLKFDEHCGRISFDDGSNFLANYEEGTWTPSIGAATSNPTVAYTTQLGKYTRIGNLVHIKAVITINTISGGSGNIRINGLPFNTANDSMTQYSGSISTTNVLWDSADQWIFQMVANGTVTQLLENFDNNSGSGLPIGNLANGDTINFEAYYWV